MTGLNFQPLQLVNSSSVLLGGGLSTFAQLFNAQNVHANSGFPDLLPELLDERTDAKEKTAFLASGTFEVVKKPFLLDSTSALERDLRRVGQSRTDAKDLPVTVVVGIFVFNGKPHHSLAGFVDGPLPLRTPEDRGAEKGEKGFEVDVVRNPFWDNRIPNFDEGDRKPAESPHWDSGPTHAQLNFGSFKPAQPFSSSANLEIVPAQNLTQVLHEKKVETPVVPVVLPEPKNNGNAGFEARPASSLARVDLGSREAAKSLQNTSLAQGFSAIAAANRNNGNLGSSIVAKNLPSSTLPQQHNKIGVIASVPQMVRKAAREHVGAPVFADVETSSGKLRVHYQVEGDQAVFAGVEVLDRRPAQLSSADVWLPRAIGNQNDAQRDLNTVFGFVSRAGGESTLPQYEVDSDSSVGHRLLELLVLQLKNGPGSLADDSARLKFNLFLKGNHHVPFGASLEKDQWHALITKSILYAMANVPAFDKSGMRDAAAIYEDAAWILGIDSSQLRAWEDFFGLDSIFEHLLSGELPQKPAGIDAPFEDLLHYALLGEVEFRAAAALGKMDEVALEWDVARISMIEEPQSKIKAAFEFVYALAKRGKIAAGRALALIVAHSKVSENKGVADSLASRWTEGEVAQLIERIMGSDAWAVASHRTFREYLTPDENKRVNKFVSYGNLGSAVAIIKDIDVRTTTVDEFFAAMEKTGRMPQLLDRAEEMMLNAALKGVLLPDVN